MNLNKTMHYKLIAFDIDGTIRSLQDPVSDKNTSVINRLIDNGIIVTIATGRMFLSASLALKGLHIIHPIISYKGGHIADINTGNILWHMPLTKELADHFHYSVSTSTVIIRLEMIKKDSTSGNTASNLIAAIFASIGDDIYNKEGKKDKIFYILTILQKFSFSPAKGG